MSTAEVIVTLAVAVIGLVLVVATVVGMAWAMTPRRPGTTRRRQHSTAGPLLDRTEPWA